MKTNKLLAVMLIVIGIVAFVYQGITFTTRESLIDIGPIKITSDNSRTIPLPPIVGGVSIVGGILLLAIGRRKARLA